MLCFTLYMDAPNLNIRRIIWALDALDESGPVLQHAINTVRVLRKRFPDAEIQPIYIFTPGEFNFSADISAPYSGPWLEPLKPAAEKALRSAVSSVPSELRVLPPRLLTQSFSSAYGLVSSLLKYCEQWKSDLVLCSTHGQNGLRRFFFGSFALSLIRRSPVPVVVVGPEARSPGDFDKILFPTGFGKYSKEAFRECVGLAGKIRSRITIYQAVSHIFQPVFQAGPYLAGTTWVPLDDSHLDDLKFHEKHLHHWASYAKHQNVSCETVVELEANNTAVSIARVARRQKSSLIVMELEKGSWFPFPFQSVMQRLLKISSCPVLVMNQAYLKNRVAESTRKRAGGMHRKAA